NWGSPGLDSSLRLFNGLNSRAKLLLVDGDTAPYARPDFHAAEVLPFYDWCLKGEGESFAEQPDIRYQPVGQELFRSVPVWPPAAAQSAALHLSAAVDG